MDPAKEINRFEMKSESYPFVKSLITDPSGDVHQVVLDLVEYKRLLEAIEDEGLIQAMREAEGESSLSLQEALAELTRA
jgi:RelB Antitoxin alpha helical domain